MEGLLFLESSLAASGADRDLLAPIARIPWITLAEAGRRSDVSAWHSGRIAPFLKHNDNPLARMAPVRNTMMTASASRAADRPKHLARSSPMPVFSARTPSFGPRSPASFGGPRGHADLVKR